MPTPSDPHVSPDPDAPWVPAGYQGPLANLTGFDVQQPPTGPPEVQPVEPEPVELPPEPPPEELPKEAEEEDD